MAAEAILAPMVVAEGLTDSPTMSQVHHKICAKSPNPACACLMGKLSMVLDYQGEIWGMSWLGSKDSNLDCMIQSRADNHATRS